MKEYNLSWVTINALAVRISIKIFWSQSQPHSDRIIAIYVWFIYVLSHLTLSDSLHFSLSFSLSLSFLFFWKNIYLYIHLLSRFGFEFNMTWANIINKQTNRGSVRRLLNRHVYRQNLHASYKCISKQTGNVQQARKKKINNNNK